MGTSESMIRISAQLRASKAGILNPSLWLVEINAFAPFINSSSDELQHSLSQNILLCELRLKIMRIFLDFQPYLPTITSLF
jgi:hypothetical protein